MSLCECGCGEEVAKEGNRFILGHNTKGKGKTLSPEHCAALSKAHIGVPLSSEHCAAISKAKMGISIASKGVLRTSEDQIASDEAKRGGHDIIRHHYLYDHNDLSLNTVRMTRSDHMKLHRLLQKLGYIVPHINIKEE